MLDSYVKALFVCKMKNDFMILREREGGKGCNLVYGK